MSQEAEQIEINLPTRRRSLFIEVLDECYRDDVLGHAAQLGFYFLFALFPMLIFLTALVGYLPIPHLLDNLLSYLAKVLPSTALALVRQTTREITQTQRGGLLSLGLIVSLWASSSGMHALIYSLNIAYSVKNLRPWWRERMMAILLTFGLSFFIISALAILFFGEHLVTILANTVVLNESLISLLQLVQWPLLILFVLIGLELIYYCAPRRPRQWKWVTPGGLFALVAWLLISYAFKYYVVRITNYTLTYGSLGSVIVLMLWLYLTSISILIGGEINGVLEQRIREQNATNNS